MRKPEARIYQHVLNAENVPAEQAVFFDDVEANVLAAKAVGINAIHVTDRQIIPTYFSL